nr:integrase, catalytic region, zinc finger, CCHC-type, peptidase aspartic, catalytic [Tanacetum cinerariifolium]
MTGNRALLTNFVEKFLGTVRFGNNDFAVIAGYGDVVIDKVVSLLEKEKANLETIESLKSKGFESSENVSSESENQTENDCLVVEKECDKEENPKKKKGSSNTSNVGLSAVNISNLKKNVKRYSRKDLFCLERQIVHICLWIIDSGCSKHMTGNRALLMNFMEKFIGTVRFGNNDFNVIAGYGDVVIGSMTIKKVYYVEGLGHNLFSIGQFCDKGLEVAFRKSTCFVRNKDGVDLLTGKIHRKHHKSKTDSASNKPLYLLHMDLCGPIRVKSINGKRYVLVVVDDYSRYTWVLFFHSKDEASEVIISFIKKTQVKMIMVRSLKTKLLLSSLMRLVLVNNFLLQECLNKMVSWKGEIEP